MYISHYTGHSTSRNKQRGRGPLLDFAKSIGLRLLKSGTAKKIGTKLLNSGTAYIGRKIQDKLGVNTKKVHNNKGRVKKSKKTSKKKVVLSGKKQKGRGSVSNKNSKIKKCNKSKSKDSIVTILS